MRLNVLCAALLAGGSALPAAAQTSFTGIGDLPGGLTESSLEGVSDNGLVAVGTGNIAAGEVAVLWTASGGLVSLGVLPGGTTSRAFGASADGSVIVGVSRAPFNRAFRWTQAGGMVDLGLPVGRTQAQAFAVSNDGSVVVGGAADFGGNEEAFRWTQAGGMVGLGDLPGGAFRAEATGVSADGSVVVGRGTPASGQEAFRWTQAGGMIGLGDLPGGIFFSTAEGVSADGSVVVGRTSSASGFEAFRWTQGSGMVGLGDLPGGSFDSLATAVSADGSVIVGSSDAGGIDGAFVWTQATGMQSLAAVLTSRGVNLGAWFLDSPSGISADGSVIIGTGTNPAGANEGWIATGFGLITPTVLAASAQSLSAAPAAAHQMANAHQRNAMAVARSFGRGGLDEKIGALTLWGSFDAERYDDFGDGSIKPNGGAGLAWRASRDVRLGLGGRWGSRAGDLGAFGGAFDSESKGLDAFAAFERGATGLRLHAVFAADWLSSDVARGYLNGVAPVTSEGAQKGFLWSGSLGAGWAFGSDGFSIGPFADYQLTHLSLDPYAETTGVFPAAVNGVKETLHVTRLGAEARANLGGSVNFWASGAWGHRFDDTLPGVSGRIVPLNLSFAGIGYGVDGDWAEGGVGLSYRPAAGALIHARFGASTDGRTEPELSFGVGAAISF